MDNLHNPSETSPRRQPDRRRSAFYSTDGQETAAVAQSLEWSKHPLGPPDAWSLELRTTLSIIFNTRQPMHLFWGEHHICFYNDGYLPIVSAAKHPWAMGRPGEEVWAEAWPVLLPQIEQVEHDGRATWNENQLIPLLNDGVLVDSWFTYSYSPVFLLDGTVGGTLVTCAETTEQIRATRGKTEALKAAQQSAMRLTEERAHLQGIFDQVPFPFCILEGPDYVYTLTNPAYDKLAGRPVLGKAVREAFSDEEVGHYLPIMDRVSRENKPVVISEAPLNLVDEQGRTQSHFINVVYYPYRDAGGGATNIMIVVYEVTEQVRARQAIAESEARFRTMANSIPQLAWMADPTGHVFWYNERWYEYTGTTFEEMQGWGWEKVHHPDLSPVMLPKWKNALATGQPWDDTFQLKGKDGLYRWFLSRAMPIRDDSGKIVRWFGSNTDITEQLRVESELRYQSQLTRTITDNAASCLFMMDKQGRPTFMNPAAMRVTGYQSLDEIKDRSLHYAVHWKRPDGSHYPMEDCPIDNAQAERVVVQDQEEIFCKKDGTLFPVSFSLMPLQNDGQVIGSVLEFRDITEQKRAESALKGAVRARDEFLSIASHELKTPLTSLKLQTQLMIRLMRENNPTVYAPERVTRLVEQTAKQTDRLARLVDDMLDIARIEAGKFSVVKTSVDLCQLVSETAERLRPQFDEAHTSLTIACCEPVKVEGDAERLEQVVVNLLTNAIRYGKKKPVRLDVRRQGGVAQFSVRDEGLGIAPEHQARVFNRFERAISSNEISGLGLGLYISRQIVESHGGRISVESKLGEGSTFIVGLPMRNTGVEPNENKRRLP